MLKTNNKFKKGAASMYVVVIAALLFGVITISFIRLIISESLRTTNDELAQSAYDSALAGVEDAKTALRKYYSCLGEDISGVNKNNLGNDCQRAKFIMSNALNGVVIDGANDEENCAIINNALNRNGSTEYNTSEVQVKQSSSGDSNTEQAYTCVTISDQLPDYKATLSSSVTTRVIPLKYANPDGATNIYGIKFSWYSTEDGTSYTTTNSFKENYSTPPEISLQLIQTGATFSFTDFKDSSGSTTNRGTVFLKPSTSSTESNYIEASKLVQSNTHTQSNTPKTIKCASGSDFACSTTLQLPNPVGGGTRNPETFFLVVTLPYGNPTTHFSVQMCTNSTGLETTCDPASFNGVQTAVDSTGRANDMFSRVEARIELADINFPYAEFALQLSGDGTPLNKNFYVTKNCWSDTASCNSGTAD